MATTTLNIIPRKQIEAAQTSQYTSNGVRTIIDKFTVTNTTAANAVFSCNLIPNGGSASDDNLVLYPHVIAPGTTYRCPELVGQILESGGFISTLSDTVTALTISASGRQIT